MSLIMIVIVKDISEESLCLHLLKRAIVVGVVLLEDDFDVFVTLVSALRSAVLKAGLILVEDIGRKQVSEEVEANEHEENEQEAVPVVDVLRRKVNVREVSRGEQNSDVFVSVADRVELSHTFEHWSVEIVDCKYEEHNIGEDRGQNGERVPQITEKAEHCLAQLVREGKKDNDTHEVGKVGVLQGNESASQVNARDDNSDNQETSASLFSLGLMAPSVLIASHDAETDHASNVDQDGDERR